MEEKTQEKVDKMAVYEVSYLLLPSLAQEQVPDKAKALKEQLTLLGGEVLSLEDPILIDLAYPMVKVIGTKRQKCTSGYFGWVKFEMSPEGIEKVKKAFDMSQDIIRYIIIKTVRENTLLSGKMMLKKEDKIRKEEEEIVDEEVPQTSEIGPEELDKSIDELVIA